MNGQPFMEIHRIIEGPRAGRYRVRVYDSTGLFRGTIATVYRYRWVARWFGAADAKKLLKQDLYPPPGFRSWKTTFVRRIDL